MNKRLSIRTYRISSKGEILYPLWSYKWKNNQVTKHVFDSLRKDDIHFTKGAICLDLFDEANYNILDTITLRKDDFNRLLNKEEVRR